MLKKSFKYILIAAIACYLVFAFIIAPSLEDKDECRDLVINISGNRLGTINNDEIINALKENNLYPKGKMMDSIKKGVDPMEAIEKASGKYGRFDEAVKKIDPRKE